MSMSNILRDIEKAFVAGGRKARTLYVSHKVFEEIRRSGAISISDPVGHEVLVHVTVDAERVDGWRLE